MNKKIMGLLIASGALFLIAIILIIVYCFTDSDSVKVQKEKYYEKYLVDKYGDQGFKYANHKDCEKTASKPTYCTCYFTTKDMKYEFAVYGEYKNNELKFIDSYIKVKYENKLNDDYNKKFASMISPEIKLSYIDYKNNDIPNMSYDKYVKYVKKQELTLIFDYKTEFEENPYINVLMTDELSNNSEFIAQAGEALTTYMDNSVNFTELHDQIINALNTLSINNVSLVQININGCTNDDYSFCTGMYSFRPEK